ncbi:hypothetical protein ACVWW2_002447 [Bradyrhizobium sp. LM4.3]
MSPFEPKPPPRNGLRMWILSCAMPNNSATRASDSMRPWVGMSICRLSPSQLATIACGSIAL